jgi:hypothetical protein
LGLFADSMKRHTSFPCRFQLDIFNSIKVQARRDGIKQYTLDADAMEVVGEKAEALFTYKGNRGYMPVAGYLYETPVCWYDEFREGKVSPAFEQKEFYLRCKERMPEGKRIGFYRADSASYQAGILNQLEEDGVKFAITADQDQAVKSAIGMIGEEEWKEPVRGCGYELADTVHCMNGTKEAFRLVVKRELWRQREFFDKEGPYFYHAVATNWWEEEKDNWEVLKWHNQRGQAENFNKELKIGMGMERMPCGQSYANAVFFLGSESLRTICLLDLDGFRVQSPGRNIRLGRFVGSWCRWRVGL